MANEQLKLNYTKTIEVAMLVVLMFLQLTFVAFRFFDVTIEEQVVIDVPRIDVKDIPETTPPKRPLRPELPAVPVESDDPELPIDATIPAYTKIDLSEIPRAPELPEPDSVFFLRVEKWPAPIGGYGQIIKHLKYPEIAKRLQLTGKAEVYVLVDENGYVLKTKINKSAGHPGLDEAAIQAIWKVKWEPAMQRDVPVKVWVNVPVSFKLN